MSSKQCTVKTNSHRGVKRKRLLKGRVWHTVRQIGRKRSLRIQGQLISHTDLCPELSHTSRQEATRLP